MGFLVSRHWILLLFRMVKDNRFGCNIFLDSPAKESHWHLGMSILFIRSNNIRQFIFLGHSCFKTSNIYQLFTVQVVKSKLKQIRNKSWVVSQSFFSMIKIKILAGPKISVCFSLGNLHLPVLLPCLFDSSLLPARHYLFNFFRIAMCLLWGFPFNCLNTILCFSQSKRQ